jgi:Uma2 family endonuclease
MFAPAQPWTAHRVRALIDESRPWPRYELIDGELLVTPAPRLVHQAAVGELFRALANFADRERLPVSVFTSPADLELVPNTIVQPDVFVVPVAPDSPLPDWTHIHALTLAVEVISPSSARHDRTTKRRFFTQRADVAEYWLVDLEARVVERWLHGDARPTVHDDVVEWKPSTVREPLAIHLPAFFKRVWRD